MNQSLRISFRETAQPIRTPETKFGGSPVWVDSPQWPLSARTGGPMSFIGQIALDRRIFPHAVARMAYVFMTNDERVDQTWDPDAGENAVILQPGPTAIAHAPLHSGPSIYLRSRDPVTQRSAKKPVEFATGLSLQAEPAYVPAGQRDAWPDDELERYCRALAGHKTGGSPVFVQDEDFPFEDWRLLLQLDSACGLPFFVNFGDGGCGYAFSNADCTRAKFLWQCH